MIPSLWKQLPASKTNDHEKLKQLPASKTNDLEYLMLTLRHLTPDLRPRRDVPRHLLLDISALSKESTPTLLCRPTRYPCLPQPPRVL